MILGCRVSGADTWARSFLPKMKGKGREEWGGHLLFQRAWTVPSHPSLQLPPEGATRTPPSGIRAVKPAGRVPGLGLVLCAL